MVAFYNFLIFYIFEGSTDLQNPNTVVIEILIPHQSGTIPLISTSRISDIQNLLTINHLRTVNHKCSNLVDLAEVLLRNCSIGGGR